MSQIEDIMARAMGASKAWPVVFRAGSAGELASAAIAGLEAAGFVIVPREPTPRMIEAATYDLDIYWHYQSDGRPGAPEDAYCAMLAAAGEPK